ncbi:MAG TPA: hypothetical protein VHT91_04335 [Kofleriaceae bacterium]|jgi:hypothetical protein|nr:hypothetical protein [Kofleriaceae bacterium]
MTMTAPLAGGTTSTTPPPAIVLEAHAGERPAGADELLEPVIAELERRGFAARPSSIVRVLGDRAPRPGILDPSTTTAAIVALSAAGFNAYRRAEYQDAVATLTRAVSEIERNPALIVLDAVNTSTVFHAFVGLALSQAKLDRTADSIATMTELLRNFATPMIDRAEFGPQAENLLRAAHKRSEELGRGELAVNVDDRAMIFVGSELRGTGHAVVTDLIPGRYRVFVHGSRAPGRQYWTDVRAGARTTLDIAWQLDSELTLSESWSGLVFPDEAERSREAIYASALARRWGHASIVILSMTRQRGDAVVVGTIYRADGSIVRRAAAPLDGRAALLRGLGQFLAGGGSSPELALLASSDPPAGPGGTPAATAGESTLPRWPFAVTGAIGLGAGVWLLSLNQSHGHTDATGMRTPYYRDTLVPGVGVCMASAAALSFAVLQWAGFGGERRAPIVSAGPGHALVGWTGTF